MQVRGDWKPRTGPFIERLKRRGDVASLTRALRYREEAIRIPAAEALGELGTHAALWPLTTPIEPWDTRFIRTRGSRRWSRSST